MQKGIGVRTFTWCGRYSFHAYMKRKVKLMGKRDTSRGNRGEKGAKVLEPHARLVSGEN